MRWRLAFAAAVALLTVSAPAHAEPISLAILGALSITATTTAVAITTFIVTTLGSILLSKVISLFSPKANAQDRQASVAQLSIGEHPREAIFGEAATGGSLADAFNYGGPEGTDWEVLVIVVADHRCEALTGFYVGDQYVAFVGDSAIAGYNGQLMVWWRDGRLDQVLPSVLRDHGGWSASDNLAGCATIVVAYKADDPKSKTPIWTSGRPQFLWVVKGKRCYIARRDGSLPGGSGSHRWAEPSTWEWTDNLIDCRYNWQRGVYAGDQVRRPEMLLIGRGLSAVEAPPERTFAAANLCDEPVPLKAGGTERRYRCNFVVRANEEFITTEEAFAAACAGDIVQREGGVEVEPGAAKAVIAEITDDDIIVGEKVTFNRFRTDKQRINTVVPRYVEPAQKWADHAAPIRRVVADVRADGGPREDPLSLIAVTSGTQAQRVGEIRRRKGRLERNGGFTLGPRFAHLEENDWIGWTSAKHLNGARVVFRITNYELAQSWRNTISIEEVAANCFDWSAAVDEIVPGAAATQQAVPVRAAPSAADWSLAAVDLASSQGSTPALVITGASVGYAEQLLFEYRPVGGDWIDGGLGEAATTRREITGVMPGTNYVAAVSYVTDGVASDRLVLGPVTSGVFSGVAISLGGGGSSASYNAADIDAIRDRLTALETP